MKTRHIITISLTIFATFFISCGDYTHELEMWIASEQKLGSDPVHGEHLMLQYKLKESDKWMLLSEKIKGFNYEEGYEYHLSVECTHIKNPLPDQSGSSYKLAKILSKNKVD